jgi:hypothetical protein
MLDVVQPLLAPSAPGAFFVQAVVLIAIAIPVIAIRILPVIAMMPVITIRIIPVMPMVPVIIGIPVIAVVPVKTVRIGIITAVAVVTGPIAVIPRAIAASCIGMGGCTGAAGGKGLGGRRKCRERQEQRGGHEQCVFSHDAVLLITTLGPEI